MSTDLSGRVLPPGEPTVQLFEGGTKHKVSDLPGWHEHPECVYDNGKPLAHLHGLSKQPPHTHYPVKAWGEAEPWPSAQPCEIHTLAAPGVLVCRFCGTKIEPTNLTTPAREPS